MSGHCGVLHAIEQADVALGLAGLGIDDILRKELAAARADVAELIAADEEYDAASAIYDAKAPDGLGELDSRTEDDFAPLETAIRRRRAALAACKAVQP